MKRWPLRWKLAFYAAALAVVATLAGAATTWAIILSIDSAMYQVNRIGWDILLGMLGAIPTGLIVIAIGGRWVAKQALAPVEAISQAASRITVQNLDQRLPVPETADEIAELITVLNSTLDRLQRSFEQSVRFSSEASHHLKTPISVLRAGIEEILTDPDTPAKQQTRADALLHQIHQLTSIAENLLLLARADAGRLELHRERFDLSEVLRGMCEDASAMADAEGLEVEAKLPPELPVAADRRAISLIVQNLLENAIKYNELDGCISISARAVNGETEVTVKNNGEPIPPERAPHIFERFYRARADARIPGQGLGLSIAGELAKAHGGRLELLRSDREWTEFRLALPRVRIDAAHPEAILT
jgi:signal transduction histidine kinase